MVIITTRAREASRWNEKSPHPPEGKWGLFNRGPKGHDSRLGHALHSPPDLGVVLVVRIVLTLFDFGEERLFLVIPRKDGGPIMSYMCAAACR